MGGSSAGTSGQVLTSAGAGAAPTWAGVSSGLVLLSTVTASSSATVDIETTFNSTYDAYLIVASGVTVSGTTVTLQVRLKVSGAYVTSADYDYSGLDTTGTSYVGVGGASQTRIAMTNSTMDNNAESNAQFQMLLTMPTNTAFAHTINWDGGYQDGSINALHRISGAGSTSINGGLTGVRIFPSTGTIAAGKFRLYGFANS